MTSHQHSHHDHSHGPADRNILIAFIMNFAFSIIEFLGGMFINSVAIMSDSVHSLGDALSTGVAYFLELLSKRHPEDTAKYGYARYSIIGSAITTAVLLFGAIHLTHEAIERLQDPAEINYDGMIVFAILGAVLNFIAAYATHRGDNLNQKAVSIHMLSDTFSWLAVLAGAIVMKLTGWHFLDPIMSFGIAIFIMTFVIKNIINIIQIVKSSHNVANPKDSGTSKK